MLDDLAFIRLRGLARVQADLFTVRQVVEARDDVSRDPANAGSTSRWKTTIVDAFNLLERYGFPASGDRRDRHPDGSPLASVTAGVTTVGLMAVAQKGELPAGFAKALTGGSDGDGPAVLEAELVNEVEDHAESA